MPIKQGSTSRYDHGFSPASKTATMRSLTTKGYCRLRAWIIARYIAILNLLYTTLFHRTDQARGNPHVRQAIFKSVASILILHSVSGLFFPNVTSNAVEKYGPRRILDRCTNFLNHGFVLSTTTLIAQLSAVPSIHKPIFGTDRFHVKLMEKYWNLMKHPVEDPTTDSVQSVTFAILLLVGMYCAGFRYGEHSIAYISVLQVNVN